MKQRILTITYINYNRRSVPMIRIAGEWLEKLGYGIKSKIVIIEKPNELVIQKVNS